MDFNSLLLEAIDEALSSLGETPKTAIYYQLKTEFNIKTKEIPERIDDFSSALERPFGLGAKHLEILFMKILSVKVRDFRDWVSCEWVVPEVKFREYVDIMRQNYEGVNKNEEMGILINENEKLQRCS